MTLKKPAIMRSGAKGCPPPAAQQLPTSNIQKASSGKKIQIPITTFPELRREYKAYCAEREISMSQQFEKMFQFWKANNP
jgi:hypothetical protein